MSWWLFSVSSPLFFSFYFLPLLRTSSIFSSFFEHLLYEYFEVLIVLGCTLVFWSIYLHVILLISGFMSRGGVFCFEITGWIATIS